MSIFGDVNADNKIIHMDIYSSKLMQVLCIRELIWQAQVLLECKM